MNNCLNLKPYLTVVFTFVFALNTSAQNKYSLRYLPQYGDTGVQTLEINTQVKVSYSKGYTNTKTLMSFSFDIITNKAPDSGYMVTYIYRKIASDAVVETMQNGARSSNKLAVSTSDDPDDIEDSDNELKIKTYKYYKLLQNQSYTVIINPNNKVRKIEGLKELRRNLLKELRENWKESATYEQFKATIESSLSDESITNTFNSSMEFYPTESIGVGQKWSNKQSKSNTSQIEGTVTYQFNKILDDSTAEISLKMPFTMANAQATKPWKGLSTGTIILNLNNGATPSVINNTVLTGAIKNSAGKYKINSTSTTVTTTTRKHP